MDWIQRLCPGEAISFAWLKKLPHLLSWVPPAEAVEAQCVSPCSCQRPQTRAGLVWVGQPRQVRIVHRHWLPFTESQFIAGVVFLPCRYHPACLQVHGQKQQTPGAPRPCSPYLCPIPSLGSHPKLGSILC